MSPKQFLGKIKNTFAIPHLIGVHKPRNGKNRQQILVKLAYNSQISHRKYNKKMYYNFNEFSKFNKILIRKAEKDVCEFCFHIKHIFV